MSVIKEGVFIYWKKSAFLSREGCFFWPEISALGVFSNFDNERMRPLSVPESPPPHGFEMCQRPVQAVAMAHFFAPNISNTYCEA